MHHRELLGKLCRAAYETVHEMVFAAAEAIGVEGFRTGMVVVTQTAGDLLNLHPHLHGLVPRGGWDQDGAWVPIPFVDTSAAEGLFRAKVLAFLKAERLLSGEREQLLLSWDHHTGFGVHNDVTVEPEDQAGLERLARYLLGPPVSLERMEWADGATEVGYSRKATDGHPREQEHLDRLDLLARSARGDSRSPAGGRRRPFPHSGRAAPSLRTPRPRPRAAADGELLARVVPHIPEPRLHLGHYYGHYSNVSRGRRRKGRDPQLSRRGEGRHDEPDGLTPAERQARRRAWARLVRRVYELNPLVCEKCGGAMRIISVILDPAVIRAILEHLRRKKDTATRAPPVPTSSLEAAS